MLVTMEMVQDGSNSVGSFEGLQYIAVEKVAVFYLRWFFGEPKFRIENIFPFFLI